MKSFYTVLCCLTMAFAVQAQTSIVFNGSSDGSIRLTCTIQDYSVNHQGIFTDIDFAESTPVLKTGAPQVKKLSGAIIVDDQQEMQVTVDHVTFEEYSNVFMLPSKGNLLRNVDPSAIPFVEGSVYQENDFYPGKLADLGSPYVQHQYRGQGIHFYPVQYNPVTHVLRVYTSIEVTVNPTDNPGVNPLPVTVADRTNMAMHEVYRSHFLNYETESQRYEQVGEIGNMLVITHAQYIDALQPWVQWKKEKGIPVEVVDVASINSVAAIRDFVQQYYDDNGLTYLVLVGNEDQVPVQLVNYPSGQGYCDACYGYVAGNDSYADLFVGHLLVHTAAELTPLVNKILEYEKEPNTAVNWFSVAMGIGSDEGANIGDQGEADWQHQNGIKEDLLDFTYTEVWEKYDGSHASSSPSGGLTADAGGSPSSSSLTDVIESGCSLINYTGHGAHTLIVTGSYTNNQINQLQNNGRYPYFIVVGCCTGDYDDDDDTGDTFGEAWIKSPSANNLTGGIGGAFSSVYQSWAPPMEAQDEMNKIIASTAGIQTRHTVGSIHYHGCSSMNDAYGAEGDEMTDTWILMADPSMQLRTAMPTAIVANHPAGAVMGVSSVEVSCNVQDAMICATWNGEILATGVAENGQIVLYFDPITEPGDILITVSSFNTIPYQGYIPVTPADGPYVVGQAVGINDASGNGNGMADYNEQIGLNIEAANIGVEIAENVTAGVTCSHPAIVIDDSTHDFGTLAIGEEIAVTSAFTFHVDGAIEDQTVVQFVVTYTDSNGNSWQSTINVTINAPEFECVSGYDINDALGNGNGRIDSGETVSISFTVTNTGHATTSQAVTANLSISTSGVSISNPVVDLGVLEAGESAQATFTLTVDGLISGATLIEMLLELPIAFYGVSCESSVTANQNIEDWESGNDAGYNWNYSGDADWFVTDDYAYEGIYSMQSGNINDNDLTSMYISIDCPSEFELSFSYKVSTEDGYDFLTFLIDNVQQSTWSGEVDWTEATYTLSPGSHTLRWRYAKDFTVSAGQDACWVDNIVLPMPLHVEETQVEATSLLSLYPNPVRNVVQWSVETQLPGKATLRVISSTGAIVEEADILLSQAKLYGSMDCNAWAAGMYQLQLVRPSGIQTLRFVKE